MNVPSSSPSLHKRFRYGKPDRGRLLHFAPSRGMKSLSFLAQSTHT